MMSVKRPTEELDLHYMSTHMTRADETIHRIPTVLIVDDDIDSILQIESIFTRLGCPTLSSVSPVDAKRQLCSQKADIIILDWILSHHMDALDLVNECSKRLEKFNMRQGVGPWGKPKIITYSSLGKEKINHLESPYFDHVGHWMKPATQRELLNKTLTLFNKMGC